MCTREHSAPPSHASSIGTTTIWMTCLEVMDCGPRDIEAPLQVRQVLHSWEYHFNVEQEDFVSIATSDTDSSDGSD